ncbi:MAG: hypothetical protein ACREAY_01280 [Nitrososphaera sp.]|uniref:hypothetical protein n=1 Tax=Nitrososphaera sp. TaxID=1971748 RepID=UPI003D6F1E8A
MTGDPRRLTGYVQRVVKINEQEYPVSSIRTEPVKASSQTIPSLSGNPKDVLEPLARIKASGKQAIDIPGSKGFDISKFPQYDKVIATSETIYDKELRAMVGADKGRGFLGLSDVTKDIFRMERGTGKPSTPFRIGPSNEQATVTKQYLRDVGVIPSGAAKDGTLFGAAVGIAASRPFGIGRESSSGVLSGLGRGDSTVIVNNRRAKKQTIDTSIESFVSPNVDSVAKDMIKSFQANRPSSRIRNDSMYSNDLKIESLLGSGTKGRSNSSLQLGGIEKTTSRLFQGQKSRNDLLSGLFSGSGSKAINTTALIPRVSQFTGSLTATKTKQTLATVNVSTNPFRNIPSKFFYDDDSKRVNPKKKKGRKYRVKNRKFTVANPLAAVLGPFSGVGKVIQKFSDAFDNF